MSEGKEENKVLDLLAHNEENVSKLYNLYAEKFPDWDNFWHLLADEEVAHSQWLRDLYTQVEEGDLYFNEERFPSTAIITFTNYLQELITEAQKKEISLKNALNIALDIETSLIENRFFEVFASDHKEFKITLRRLEEATNNHKNRLIEALKKIAENPKF